MFSRILLLDRPFFRRFLSINVMLDLKKNVISAEYNIYKLAIAEMLKKVIRFSTPADRQHPQV